MHYLKKNTKFSILLLLILILSLTISISTLAKTEVYFSLSDNLQILSPTSPKSEVQIININTASQDELIKILKISEPLAQKIIASPLLTQLPEITNLEWQEWKEEGIVITVQ